MIESVPLKQKVVYLKVDCDFGYKLKDKASFFYSLDGKTWTKIGDELKMVYDWPDFMGYRLALFYYSTANLGGCVDLISSTSAAKSRRLNKSDPRFNLKLRLNMKSTQRNVTCSLAALATWALTLTVSHADLPPLQALPPSRRSPPQPVDSVPMATPDRSPRFIWMT